MAERKTMQDHLREILDGTTKPFDYQKPFPWVFEIKRAYKSLGGILDDFPSNVGNWDIYLNHPTAEKNLGFDRDVVIELDEDLHFNRYRYDTLNAPFYLELNAFPLIDYRHYCRTYEDAALHKGSFGGKWTNKSAEKQFGQAGALGRLEGNGAPRWKQRAFYDMLKDLASLVFTIALARISVWDHVHLEDGTTESVRNILKLEPGKVSPYQKEALKVLIRSRISTALPRIKAEKKKQASKPYKTVKELKELFEGLTPEERKRKMEYWCPDLSGQLIIVDKDGTVLVDPQKGINRIQKREE